MRLKYVGPLGEVTVRHRTFPQGVTVTMDMDDPADASLAAKMLLWPDVVEVKARRRKKSDG